jgi:hypothetical protein
MKVLTIADIAPCPFCAGKGVPLYLDKDELAGYIVCEDCAAEGPLDYSPWPSLDPIIRLWNERSNVY